METKPLGERIGSDRLAGSDTGALRSAFNGDSSARGLFAEAVFLFRTVRSFTIVVVSGIAFVVFIFGIIVGRAAFSTTVVEVVPNDGEVIITSAQADEYQQLAMKLEQAQNEVTVTEGEADFHQAQVATLADEVSRLQSRLGEAQLELNLIVSIYEECVDRLYPLECINDARPEAESFLAELYADQG